ncbi:hypothetical protein [Streptomyces sp. NPDC003077]|uniref:hypothetical protein n=1 Tax=Streptomyces sp. NPDC003077 TaxID=3154443 RepID=UPI0033A9673B
MNTPEAPGPANPADGPHPYGYGAAADGASPAERPVEVRLRRAFQARTDLIDIRDLRPAAPPGSGPRRGVRLREALRRWTRPRFTLPLAVAAAAAAAFGYLAQLPDDAPAQREPAAPPHSVSPSPSPSPTRTPEHSPFPSPSRPGPPATRSSEPPRTTLPGAVPTTPPTLPSTNTRPPVPTHEPFASPTLPGPNGLPTALPTPDASVAARPRHTTSPNG